jgi:hypothetical protein
MNEHDHDPPVIVQRRRSAGSPVDLAILLLGFDPFLALLGEGCRCRSAALREVTPPVAAARD